MDENPELRPDQKIEPLSQDTREQFIAELYGALERSNHVDLSAEQYEVSLFATGEHNVIISRQDIWDPITYELAFTVLGSGKDSTIMAETVVTAPDPELVDVEMNELERLERELEAERFKREAGLGAHLATETEARLAVELMRRGGESGRSEA